MSVVGMCCYNSFRNGYTSSACSNSAQDFSVPQRGERTKAHWDINPLGQKPTGQYPTGQKPITKFSRADKSPLLKKWLI